MTNHISVTSGPVWKLRCRVSAGVFSHERLVRFTDATGSEQTALVHCGRVHAEGGDNWLDVAAAMTEGDRTLVALPSDGSRVWVPSASITVTP
jgi:hypothetical protein